MDECAFHGIECYLLHVMYIETVFPCGYREFPSQACSAHEAVVRGEEDPEMVAQKKIESAYPGMDTYLERWLRENTEGVLHAANQLEVSTKFCGTRENPAERGLFSFRAKASRGRSRSRRQARYMLSKRNSTDTAGLRG